MQHFDMDTDRSKVDPKAEGPSFTLCGQDFTCLPALPGATVQRMALAIRVDDKGRQVYNAPNVIGFVEETLRVRKWVEDDDTGPDEDANGAALARIGEGGHWEPTDDRQRFVAIVEGNEDIVELDTLVELMNHLSEAYGERPTRRSRRS